MQYLDENGRGKGDIPIHELFEPDTVIYEGNNRHKAQLRVNDSLIARNKVILPLDKIKDLAMEWNQSHCKDPLDDKEFDELFNQSLRFVSENNRDERRNVDVGINNTFRALKDGGKQEQKEIVEKTSEAYQL